MSGERFTTISRAARFAAALACIAILSYGFGLLSQPKAPSPPAIAALPYDRDAAIILAGKQVPAEIESYYFFVLDTDTTVDQDGDEMAALLQRAAVEHEYLGIVGPDPERNRATLIHALDAAGANDLRGVVVIYVGPREQADEVSARVSRSGADVRFVVYPDDAGLSI